jgi:hypothetical protein
MIPAIMPDEIFQVGDTLHGRCNPNAAFYRLNKINPDGTFDVTAYEFDKRESISFQNVDPFDENGNPYFTKDYWKSANFKKTHRG